MSRARSASAPTSAASSSSPSSGSAWPPSRSSACSTAIPHGEIRRMAPIRARVSLTARALSLIYGRDYTGKTCAGPDSPGSPLNNCSGGSCKYIYYPKLSEDLLVAASRGVTSPLDVPLTGVCLPSCPAQNEVVRRGPATGPVFPPNCPCLTPAPPAGLLVRVRGQVRHPSVGGGAAHYVPLGQRAHAQLGDVLELLGRGPQHREQCARATARGATALNPPPLARRSPLPLPVEEGDR